MNSKKTILRPADLCSRWGVSVTTLHRWRREKFIPTPLSLGPRMIGWRIDVIEGLESDFDNQGGLQ